MSKDKVLTNDELELTEEDIKELIELDKMLHDYYNQEFLKSREESDVKETKVVA